MKKILTTLTLLITLCSFALGQDDYYFEEPDNRQYNMTMTSVIFIDGVEDSGQNIEIAAFCGEEIRGRMTNFDMEYIDIPDVFARYFRYLHVNSEETSGEIITFKAYNHDSGYELTSDFTIEFVANAMHGDLDNPVEIYFTTVVQGVAQINETEEYFNSLAEAVEAAEAGQTITLLQTTQGEGIVIDNDITIDFNGKAYTFTSPAVGSNGTQTIGFQIKKDNNVTLKNGTLNVLESAGEDFAMLIQNYADLTITDMLLDGNNLNRGNYSYVLSNNSGDVLINGNTSIIANNVEGEKHFAFDSYDYSSAGYALPTVTVNTTGTIEGAVEVSATLNLQAVGNFLVSYFAIEGNGQLYADAPFDTEIKRTVEGSTEGWGTLSSPTKEGKAVFSTTSGHDFYQYVEENELEWNNIAASIVENTYTMEAGRGYLYANTADTEVSFDGTLNNETVNYTLSYTTAQSLAGFNFIGNPFTHNISFAHLEGKIVDGYYVVGEDGTFQVRNTTTETIAPFQAILVQATEEADDLAINKTASATRAASSGALEIVVANANYSDVAYVSFNEGLGLEKIGHQNANAPLVYLTADNKNFAIAKYNQDVNEIPVSFVAKTMGQYTISVKAIDCEFNEMYLTDRMTGEKVNLLLEDYTFVATSDDNADRFVISFATTKPESIAENFTFINNGSMIINNIEGNAVVRVLDVLGRPVAEYNVTESANISTATLSSGVYMIQMYDNNGVKVQKIVVE